MQEINVILAELLSAEGNETYVRPARLYAGQVRTLPLFTRFRFRPLKRGPSRSSLQNEELSFFDVMARARARKEVALGYVVVDRDSYDITCVRVLRARSPRPLAAP